MGSLFGSAEEELEIRIWEVPKLFILGLIVRDIHTVGCITMVYRIKFKAKKRVPLQHSLAILRFHIISEIFNPTSPYTHIHV